MVAIDLSYFSTILAGVRPHSNAFLGSTDSSYTSEADPTGGGQRLARKIGWNKLEV